MVNQDTQTLSQDVAFDLLSNVRRRFVLRCLQEHDEGIELGELATKLAARENGIPPEEVSSQQRKRTYVSLYQTHVPKLVEAGVVRYDPDVGVVEATDELDELAAYFQTDEDRVNWNPIYAIFALVGLVVYAIVVTLQPAVLNPNLVGFAILIGIVILSVVHYLHATTTGANGSTIPVERE